MVIFLVGGVRSSKSTYAEELLTQCNQKTYIATMINNDSENNQRIIIHKSRRDSSWNLLEIPYNLDMNTEINDEYVLLDCLTNLLANELFVLNKKPLDAIYSIIKGISFIKSKTKKFVIVSNNIFEDGNEYFDETKMFLKTLGELHKQVVKLSDKVYEVEYGLRRKLKG